MHAFTVTRFPVSLGEVLSLEAVSPSTLIFTPPEELTLEVRAKGHYSSIQWSRNGIAAGSESFATSPQSFVHFGEVYNVGASTVEDLGAYDVVLDPAVKSSQSLPTRLRFNVLLPGVYGICLCVPVCIGCMYGVELPNKGHSVFRTSWFSL